MDKRKSENAHGFSLCNLSVLCTQSLRVSHNDYQTWACATVPISGNAHKNVVEIFLNKFLVFMIVFNYIHTAGLPARHRYDRIFVVFGCVQTVLRDCHWLQYYLIRTRQAREEEKQRHQDTWWIQKSSIMSAVNKKMAFLSLIWSSGFGPHCFFLPLFYQFPTLTLFLSTHTQSGTGTEI